MTTDLIASGAAWLTEQATSKLATTVTYRTDDGESSIAATWGRTEFELDDAAGMTISSHVTDFIIATALMAADPVVGDKIFAGTAEYEVMNFAGEGCWRWTTPHRTSRRIHTRDIGATDATS